MKRCGSVCWTAEDSEKCSCICRGAMHGRGGERVRRQLVATLGVIPKTPEQLSAAISRAARRLAPRHEPTGFLGAPREAQRRIT